MGSHSVLPDYCVTVTPKVPAQLYSKDKQEKELVNQTYNTAIAILLDYLNHDCSLVNEKGAELPVLINKQWFQGHVFPANKIQTELLSVKVKELKKDVAFAKRISQHVDLQILTFRESSAGGTKRIPKSQWSSFEVVKTETKKECAARDQKAKTTKKIPTKTNRNRGVQRQGTNWKSTADSSLSEQLPQPGPVLFVEFVFSGQTIVKDSRLTDKSKYGGDLKSFRKQCQKRQKDNRSMVHFKGFQNSSTRLLGESKRLNNHYNHYSKQYSDSTYIDEGLDSDADTSNSRAYVFNILDFCRENKPVSRKQRNSSHSSTDQSNLIAINSTKAHVVYCQNQETTAFITEPPNSEEGQYTEVTQLASKKVVAEVGEKNKKDFSFTIQLKIDMEDDLLLNQTKIKKPLISVTPLGLRYTTGFGNCKPRCFLMKLSEVPHLAVGKYRLLGREYGNRDTWHIVLEDTTSVNKSEKLHNSLISRVTESDGQILDMHTLANKMYAAISTIEPIRISEQVTGPWQNKKAAKHLFANSTKAYRYNVDIADYFVCSPDEALDKCLLSNNHQELLIHKDDKITHRASASESTSFSTECAVCCIPFSDLDYAKLTLQPCLHSFCLQCWRQHARQTVKDGQISITCLMSDCTNTANETMISVFLPSSLGQRIQRKIAHRHVDLSPRCSWCPFCGENVVVLRESSTIGIPVQCDCARRFCHSCHDYPHWPATCDQFRDFQASSVMTAVDILSIKGQTVVHARPCPNCKYPIYKDGGCNHMYCTMCRTDFTWHSQKDQTYTVTNRLIAKASRQLMYFSLIHCAFSIKYLSNTFDSSVHNWLSAIKLHDEDLASFTQTEKLCVQKRVLGIVSEALEFSRTAHAACIGIHLISGLRIHDDSTDQSENMARVEQLAGKLFVLLTKLDSTVLLQPFRKLRANMVFTSTLLRKGKRMLVCMIECAKEINSWPQQEIDLTHLKDCDVQEYIRYK